MPSPTNPIELMATLGQEYRSIRADRQQERQKGTSRRRMEEQMEKLAERFERLVEHWVQDEQLRESWREFMYHDAVQPDRPLLGRPTLFRGENQAGAVVEVRETSEGGYDVLLDGVHAEYYDVPWQLHADRFAPIVIGQWTCRETFAAPAEARKALDAFLAQPGSEPPWHWAPALFEDGLIDENFSLTARGTRAVAGEPVSAAETPSGARINYCVLLANAGRSRVFTLETDVFEEKTTFEPLTEVADTTNALARAKDAQQFSDTRPALHREGPHGRLHGEGDRLEKHRKESERQYIQQVVDAAATVWGQYDICRVVVVASPQMLTRLRPVIARQLSGRNLFVVHEYPSDLVWQEAAAVHDALAGAGLLPSRGRKPPVRPMRTPNPWQSGG